jgi:WD repeat-containing protein 48
MDVSSDFRTVVSGGRDGVIHVVNLDSNEAGVLTSNSKPVVFIRLSPSQSSLWAVDAEGAFSQFPFSDDLSRFSDRTFKVTSPRYVSPMKGLSASLKASMSSLPMATHPSYTVLPTKGLVKAKMLRDRRHCVCRYDDGRLVVRDVCGPSSVRDLGNPEDVKDDADLDKVCAVLSLDSQKIFSPQWCSVDTSCGCLAVTLSRSNVFACDVYAVDVGFVNVQNDDTKVNVGRALLSGVFSPSQQQQLSFSCPGNVRFVIIDVLDNQRPIYWGYVAHSPPTAVLPNWVLTALDSSKEVETENQKIAFFLEPCEGSTLASIPQSSTTRLSGPRLLRCRRIAGYVSNKLSIPEGEIVEILCDGEVIPSEMNLGSMKTFYKDRTAQGEILLRYRTRISNPQ